MVWKATQAGTRVNIYFPVLMEVFIVIFYYIPDYLCGA